MSLRANAYLLLIAAALLAVTALWGATPTAAGLWRLPVGLLLAGLAYEALVVARAGLVAAIDTPQPWYLGRTMPLRVRFQHGRARALDLEVAPDAPSDCDLARTPRRIAVPAGVGAVLALQATAQRLGVRDWPALRLRIAGPLGLAWWPRQVAVAARVRVVPEALHERGVAAGLAAGGERERAAAGAGTQILQLRPYRAGDALRSIDWKTTARMRQLVSRDYSEERRLQLLIAIDVGRGSGLAAGRLDRLGHFVNVAARLAEWAAAQDDEVGLLLFADRPLAVVSPAGGAAAVARMRAVLAAARPEPVESNPLVAAWRIRTLLDRRALVVLLTDLDDHATSGPLARAVALLRPKHVPFVAALASEDLQRMARDAGADWLAPYRALAAQEQRAALERSVRALRAAGAPALLARPERLERALFAAYAELRRRRSV